MFSKNYRDTKLEKILNKVEKLPNGLFPRTTKWKLEYDKECLLGVAIEASILSKGHKMFLYEKEGLYYLFYLDEKNSSFIKTCIEDIDEFLKKYPIYEYEITDESVISEVLEAFDSSTKMMGSRVLIIHENKPKVFGRPIKKR